MPWERRKHSRVRKFFRHNQPLVTGLVIFLVVLVIVAFLFYFMTSSRFVTRGTVG